MNRSLFVTAVSISATGLLLTGCTTGATTSNNGSSANAGAGATTTVRTTIDLPGGFDPTQARSLPDYIAARMSFDTLLRKDADNKLAPGLAESWQTSGTGAVFTLRKDATCSDGTPITPTVVKNSLEYLTSKDAGSSVPPQVFGNAGPPTITADDAAGTLSVTPAAPWPDMLTGLTISATGVICPAGLKDTAALAAGTAKGAESGPYVLSAKEHAVRYTYTLRDGYNAWPKYAAALPGLAAKTVVFNVIDDKNATANQLLAGQLDIGFINANSLERFKGNQKFTVSAEPLSDFYVLFNEREGSPFTEPAKRKAVAQVLDRAAFENVTSMGNGQVTKQLVAKDTKCSNPDQSPVIEPDPEAAKALLKGLKIRMVGAQIVGPQGSGNVYVQEQLRAAGAEVALDNLDVGGWINKVYGEPSAWDLTVYADLNFAGTMSNPINAMVGPTIQEGGGNVGGTTNPDAAAALERFRQSTSEEATCSALQDAMNAIISNVDAIPLSNDPRVMVAGDGFAVISKGGALEDQSLRITK
ncbi:peptide/nickel transport system substrate-binding protein [Paenarthrobacter nitroguajacolicus]|uniref:ABC transporter substrate-binding protein n=1 Tax=Paenarthrobacter nitroguajacolicus TaxID=211146 RepID=UPI002855AC10|nr:ABC transporter substrate-binding protein [Paenarthrobacter nitroguajacolicus]MDR6989142.1 peptide/nickel transport system substrate-binding protein [Paenarthrobacter nitroguajacolicus]